jgi:hypothetical protein
MNKRDMYAYLVQETWLEGDYVQLLKHGITFIHYGPTKQESRRGSGGVAVILSEEATQNWRSRGGEIIKGGTIGETTRFLPLRLNIIKSNSKNATSLLIVMAYFPDSGR